MGAVLESHESRTSRIDPLGSGEGDHIHGTREAHDRVFVLLPIRQVADLLDREQKGVSAFAFEIRRCGKIERAEVHYRYADGMDFYDAANLAVVRGRSEE